jgi:hypothetical protein
MAKRAEPHPLALGGWPGTWLSSDPVRGIHVLALQGAVLLYAYWFVHGAAYDCFWLVAMALLANLYFLSWAIRACVVRGLAIAEELRSYLLNDDDLAVVHDCLRLARSPSANRTVGSVFTAAVVAEFVILGAIPTSGIGIVAALFVGPCLFLGAEAWYQTAGVVRLVGLVAAKNEVQFDRLRPDRTPALRALVRLHSLLVSCFFGSGVLYVVLYATVSRSVLPATARATWLYAGSWVVILVFIVVAFAILAVIPRRALVGRMEDLKSRGIAAIRAERDAIISRKNSAATSRMLASHIADASIRAIEDSPNEILPVNRLLLPVIAELASIIGLIATVPHIPQTLF